MAARNIHFRGCRQINMNLKVWERPRAQLQGMHAQARCSTWQGQWLCWVGLSNPKGAALVRKQGSRFVR